MNNKEKLGSKGNPYPVGTMTGEPNAYYFTKSGDVAQFSADGKRKGRQPGSSNGGYSIPLAALGKVPALPSLPTLTGDKEKDDVARRTYSKKLGRSLFAFIAPCLALATGGTPARTVTRERSEEELEKMISEKGIKKVSEIVKFMKENSTVTEQVPAIAGTKATLAEFRSKTPNGILSVDAGQIATAREIVSRALMDAAHDFTAEAEDAE